MSDVRWEPMGYTSIADAEGEYLAKLIYHDESEVGTPYFETNREYPLPADVRLCRATKVAEAPPLPWSQEPPTEPGDWWVWFPGDDEPMYVMVAPMDGVMYCKSVISMIPRLLPTGVWWLPATVPQPPGEVGP